jgi:hypothetical protein
VVGLLVHGDNHFIVRGPEPNMDTAIQLVRHWSLIQIGRATPSHLQPWQISTREFREDLEWAIVVPGDDEVSTAVIKLLEEISARGIAIQKATRPGRTSDGGAAIA